ncbi:MAG: ferric reductase-like transmembrane domain-containing protein [Actinomycetota bacterium]
MNPQTWWYLSRGSGIVAWVMLAATNLWGILLVTRMLKPVDRPAWLLDLHRWLAALTVITTAVHLGGLVADNYAHFGWREIALPQACHRECWPSGASKAAAVTWGVIALYIIIVVQVSSLMMRKLPRKVWHGIHLLSYVAFFMATVHAVMAGTDRGNIVFIATVSAMTGGIALAGVGRALYANGKSKIKREKANAA